jgi:hypothetical protein
MNEQQKMFSFSFKFNKKRKHRAQTLQVLNVCGSQLRICIFSRQPAPDRLPHLNADSFVVCVELAAIPCSVRNAQ